MNRLLVLTVLAGATATLTLTLPLSVQASPTREPACRSSQFRLRDIGGQGSLGTYIGFINGRNLGPSCTIKGFVRLTLADSAGQLPLKERHHYQGLISIAHNGQLDERYAYPSSRGVDRCSPVKYVTITLPTEAYGAKIVAHRGFVSCGVIEAGPGTAHR